MKLVRQETSKGCGVACVAMLLDISYDEAQTLLVRDPNDFIDDCDFGFLGVSTNEVNVALFHGGVCSMIWHHQDLFAGSGSWAEKHWHLMNLPTRKELLARYHNGGTMAVVVDSLNYPGMLHWIVLHDGKVYDPSTLLTYSDVCFSHVNEAVIIGGF